MSSSPLFTSSSTSSPDDTVAMNSSSSKHLLSRRDLLRTSGYAGAAALSVSLLPRAVHALASGGPPFIHVADPLSDVRWNNVPIEDPAVKALALRAIEAAKSAGAQYADARLTRTQYQSIAPLIPNQTVDRQTLAIGVRVLINGYWGFASSQLWTDQDAVRLAQEAAQQAKFNALGPAQTVDLGTIPVASGSWTTPVKIDPFTIPFEERLDFFQSWMDLARIRNPRQAFLVVASGAFQKQGRAIATSEGAYFTQTLWQSVGYAVLSLKHPDWRVRKIHRAYAYGMEEASKGWELMIEADPHSQILRMYDEVQELLLAPEKPVDIGRFDVVFPASVVAALVDQTIGMPTELDRALGFEANAGGTSYLNQPLKMLGSYKVGNPSITVTGNRSADGGLATVKWDDEGVIPTEMTLVRNGIVTDFQTTREQAAWLAPWYQQQKNPVQSHGCAGSATALDITMQRSPNLVLQPGKESIGLEDLIADTKKGILVVQSNVTTDFQGRTGTGASMVLREIVDGKRGALLNGANFLFNTSQLWSDVIALGGHSSAAPYAMRRIKGQPAQENRHSVSAVPMTVKDVAIFDNTRKA